MHKKSILRATFRYLINDFLLSDHIICRDTLHLKKIVTRVYKDVRLAIGLLYQPTEGKVHGQQFYVKRTD